MDPELGTLVEAFLRKHPQLAVSVHAANQCVIATDQLIEELRAAGRDAQKLWFKGHRAPVMYSPPGPTGAESEHAAVLVDGRVIIDVTRRQYERGADLPTVYPGFAAAGRHWLSFQLDPERRSDYRPLPAESG